MANTTNVSFNWISSGKKSSVMSNDCSHINTIDDIHTGDEICLDCGMVVGEIYVIPNLKKKMEEKLKNDFIYDFCQNNFLSKAVEIKARAIFSSIEKYRGNYSLNIVYLYSIYSALISESQPMGVDVICCRGSVSTKEFLKFEKKLCKFNKQASFCNLLEEIRYYVTICGSYLNINYQQKKEIENICQNLYGLGNYKISSLVACIFMLYGEANFLNFNLRQICSILNVSYSNIIRLVKIIGKNLEISILKNSSSVYC